MSNSVPDLSKEFAGRRAPVKGGSLGIGAAIAQRLLDGYVSFAVVARNRPCPFKLPRNWHLCVLLRNANRT